MRTLKTVAFAGLLAAFALTSDASACHKKKCACPAPAPAPVVCAPVAVAECAPAPKKCHMKMPKMPKMGCHKKAAPVAECAPVSYAPVAYAAPAPTFASPQASGQR